MKDGCCNLNHQFDVCTHARVKEPRDRSIKPITDNHRKRRLDNHIIYYVLYDLVISIINIHKMMGLQVNCSDCLHVKAFYTHTHKTNWLKNKKALVCMWEHSVHSFHLDLSIFFRVSRVHLQPTDCHKVSIHSMQRHAIRCVLVCFYVLCKWKSCSSNIKFFGSVGCFSFSLSCRKSCSAQQEHNWIEIIKEIVIWAIFKQKEITCKTEDVHVACQTTWTISAKRLTRKRRKNGF